MKDRRTEAADKLAVLVDALTTGDSDLDVALRRYAYACELAGLTLEAQWAWTELSGYATRDDAPDYRTSLAILKP